VINKWWSESKKSTKIIALLTASIIAFIIIFLIMLKANETTLLDVTDNYVNTGVLQEEDVKQLAPVIIGFIVAALISIAIGLLVGWKIIQGTLKGMRGPGIKSDITSLLGIIPKINDKER